jgi:CSLREA domain-containing protein
VAVDASGNLFIADGQNRRVRKVNTATGVITTVAGTGTDGFAGDGGAATSASLAWPHGVAVDAAGNLFIAARDNNRIRRVDAATGLITTVAGSGPTGYDGGSFAGDGGLATSASLFSPSGVAVDAAGNLFIADTNTYRVRKVDAATGIITTVAGTGPPVLYGGDGGAATSARLNGPQGVAVDAAGNLFIADTSNHRVRKVAGVAAAGPIVVRVGPGAGVGTAVTGIITTVAGTGPPVLYGGDGGPATSASLDQPIGVAVDAAGNLFISDYSNARIRKVDAATGIITTVAGSGVQGFSGDVGLAISARLSNPEGVAVDAAGNLFIADTENDRIRRVDAATGVITAVAGTGTRGFSGDGGPATSANLSNPRGVAVDGAGNLFIADTLSHHVRKVAAATDIITTVAGTDSCCFSGDGGPATSAGLNAPEGVAVDAAGNIFIADTGYHRVRRVDAATRVITTVAGTGTRGFSGDGGPATSASLDQPFGVAVDAAGNLFISDYSNARIRKVDAATGLITTVAGSGPTGYDGGSFAGDGGLATSASLFPPSGVAVDAAGNLFIADAGNNRIRKVAGVAAVLDRSPAQPTPTQAQAATFTVNSANDVNDSVCNETHCSLREAINAANANPGKDTIAFKIPGAGPHTIRPALALPTIADPVIIDGYTQPGASPNTNGPGLGSNAALKIELDGSNAGNGVNGLTITAGNSNIRGLVINRFLQTAGQRVANFGLALQGNGGNVIEGNIIGANLAGTQTTGLGNYNGIAVVNSPNNLIGSAARGSRNVISGNLIGINISGSGSTGNLVLGNFIGTDITGAVALPASVPGYCCGGGIDIEASNNTVGGTSPEGRNIISGSDGIGLRIVGDTAQGNLVHGNFIGTDVTGTISLGNTSDGVRIQNGPSNNTIGGLIDGARNIISGNGGDGINMFTCCLADVFTVRGINTTRNTVLGNLIGTDVSGINGLGNNGSGVRIDGGSSNTVGGTLAEARHVIPSNKVSGVIIEGTIASDNFVQGNFIGTKADGVSPLGNSSHGVVIGPVERLPANTNTIGGASTGAGNVIAFNGLDGVVVGSGTANVILSNAIFSNGRLGIDLVGDGITPNDLGDADIGPNNLQNFPVLSPSATFPTQASGTLNSTSNTTFRLEFFSNAACDPVGHGEGQTFVGSTNVTTDGSGNVSFTVAFSTATSVGHFITATATDSTNNTSELSQCNTVSQGGNTTGTSTPQVLPATALAPLGTNLVRVWGFDNATKEWSFFDPRPGFAAANSIKELVTGRVYWINVKIDQTVTLGSGTYSLSAGWNLIGWLG